VDRADKIWFVFFSVLGTVILIFSFALLLPLLVVGRPWFLTVQHQQSFSLPLFAAGFLFLVLSWFVASSESSRVVGVCLIFGILSIIISTLVSLLYAVDARVYDLTAGIGFGLVGGGVFALFYKVTRMEKNHVSTREGVRFDKAWFGLLSVVAAAFLLAGGVPLLSLLTSGGSFYFGSSIQWACDSWLFGIGTFFLVLAFFVATGDSGRVVRAFFVLGIVFIVLAELLAIVFGIETILSFLIDYVGFGLIGGSVFAQFFKVSRVGKSSDGSLKG
jgi:hypothetical protein